MGPVISIFVSFPFAPFIVFWPLAIVSVYVECDCNPYVYDHHQTTQRILYSNSVFIWLFRFYFRCSFYFEVSDANSSSNGIICNWSHVNTQTVDFCQYFFVKTFISYASFWHFMYELINFYNFVFFTFFMIIVAKISCVGDAVCDIEINVCMCSALKWNFSPFFCRSILSTAWIISYKLKTNRKKLRFIGWSHVLMLKSPRIIIITTQTSIKVFSSLPSSWNQSHVLILFKLHSRCSANSYANGTYVAFNLSKMSNKNAQQMDFLRLKRCYLAYDDITMTLLTSKLLRV